MSFLLLGTFFLPSCEQRHTINDTSKEEPRRPAPTWEASNSVKRPGTQHEDVDFVLEAGSPYPCEHDKILAPEQSLLRLSVPLELVGTSSRTVPVSAMAFSLEDQEGHRFRPTLAGCAASIPHKELTRDVSIQGEVAFDVPDINVSFDLLFRPFVIGRKEVLARVRLPALRKPRRPSK